MYLSHPLTQAAQKGGDGGGDVDGEAGVGGGGDGGDVEGAEEELKATVKACGQVVDILERFTHVFREASGGI